MRPRSALIGALLACIPAVAGRAQAIHSVASLAGLAGVQIVVADLDPDLQRQGLAELTVRNDVELRLRQGGIGVLGQVQACDSMPCVYVHVSVTTVPRQSAYFVHVGLQQMVHLSRDPSVALSVETWHAQGRVGVATGSELPGRVLDAIRSEVSQLVTAFQNANRGQ